MTTTSPVPQVLPAIPADYLEQIEAVAQTSAQVDDLVSSVPPAGITSVYLLGCGGSLFTFAPLRNILDRSPVPVFTFNADEFLLRHPAMLSSTSLVIVSSSNGATGETARAATAAREHGATVIGVTQDPNSVVAGECEHLLLHKGVEAKQVLLAQIGWSLLRRFEVAPEYDAVVRALENSPQSFLSALHEWDDELEQIARALYAEPVVYVLGSGPFEGAAQTFAMCYLQEMQWKHAVAPGSGEFLHGPFEVVTSDVPAIVFKGEDPTRPMGDRVESFLRRYTDKVYVLDAATLELPGIEPEMRALVGTMVASSGVLNRLAEHFESWSGHPLKDRRYMWTVEY